MALEARFGVGQDLVWGEIWCVWKVMEPTVLAKDACEELRLLS